MGHFNNAAAMDYLRILMDFVQHVNLREGDILGIEARAAQLTASATPRQAGEVLEGLKRLIAPAEMGTLFKVMALTNWDQPAPEGFA